MRRAITLETVTDPNSISDDELDELLTEICFELQAAIPEDPDVVPLAYGKLMYMFRKGVEYPKNLENDQIEDWLLGQAVTMLAASYGHRMRIYGFLDKKYGV